MLAAAYPTLSDGELLVRLGAAGALSLVVGLEREIRDRSAGLRTHLFVGLGSALFTIVGAYGFQDFLVAGPAVVRTDPTRIAAQVVTGIGFLGAGSIIRSGLSVKGLTSAATLWVVAAIGMACAAGMFFAATISTAVVLIGLGPLRALGHAAVNRIRQDRVTYRIGLAEGATAWPVLDVVQELGASVRQVVLRDDEEEGRWLTVTCDLPSGVAAGEIAERIGREWSVSSVDW